MIQAHHGFNPLWIGCILALIFMLSRKWKP